MDTHLAYAQAIVDESNAHPCDGMLVTDIADAISDAMLAMREALAQHFELYHMDDVANVIRKYGNTDMPKFDLGPEDEDDEPA